MNTGPRSSSKTHTWVSRNAALGLWKCSVCAASRVIRSDGGVYFVVGGVRQTDSPQCLALGSLPVGGAP